MIDVTCAIIVNEGKILVTQRSEGMSLPLKWEFPGGKIESDEKEEDCLMREIREELNLEIEILKRLEPQIFSYPTVTIRLIPFIAIIKSGEIALNEHKSFKWLEKEELRKMDWAAADIPVLEAFLKSNYDSTRAL